jgi:hypothetical protein
MERIDKAKLKSKGHIFSLKLTRARKVAVNGLPAHIDALLLAAARHPTSWLDTLLQINYLERFL